MSGWQFDQRGCTQYPYECQHMSPPCGPCSDAGKSWSQFDPERGSSRPRPCASCATLTAQRDEARAETAACVEALASIDGARLAAESRLDAARALAAETVAWFDNECHDGGPKSSCAACVLHARWRDWSGPE